MSLLNKKAICDMFFINHSTKISIIKKYNLSYYRLNKILYENRKTTKRVINKAINLSMYRNISAMTKDELTMFDQYKMHFNYRICELMEAFSLNRYYVTKFLKQISAMREEQEAKERELRSHLVDFDEITPYDVADDDYEYVKKIETDDEDTINESDDMISDDEGEVKSDNIEDEYDISDDESDNVVENDDVISDDEAESASVEDEYDISDDEDDNEDDNVVEYDDVISDDEDEYDISDDEDDNVVEYDDVISDDEN